MTSSNASEVDTVEPSEVMPPQSADDRLLDEPAGRNEAGAHS
ncbi:hypothetical protein [Streptomyces sp. NPDC007346]